VYDTKAAAARQSLQVHILSFEGPDGYARAGGIASRISGLAEGLAAAGIETHLWFVGDPELPGHERCDNLHLHRWCQWISRYHPAGVYDGEEGKRTDFATSLPPFLIAEHVRPHVRAGGQVAVLAEEWHTADAVLHLDWLLREEGVRDAATLLWNANNTFGFDRIDWARLDAAARITTVSRYMRCRMWELGVDPLVIPNGLPADALSAPDPVATARLTGLLGDRLALTKVGRWDPDKRWLLAIDTVGELKRNGRRPLLIARGGVEAHGGEVLERAAASGLRVVDRAAPQAGIGGLLESLREIGDADIVNLRTPLTPDACRLLFRGTDAVLANSGHEPFGLVGLETLAAGGIACVGGTGEDYAIPGWNCLVLQTTDPREFLRLLEPLQSRPRDVQAMRRNAVHTARRFVWNEVIGRNLLPYLHITSAGQSTPRQASRRVRPVAAQPGERTRPNPAAMPVAV
jgi:glycosyltransferase involved in cell wall biosynthesis